jgi:hypothetical protein
MVEPPSLHLFLYIAIPLMAVAMVSGGASAMDFEEVPVQITEGTGEDMGSLDLAVGIDDEIYAVWQDSRDESHSAGDAILYSIADPLQRGRVWGDTLRIQASLSNADQWNPSIDVGPDGTVHVVWQERSRSEDAPSGPFWEVRYSRSLNGGTDWSEPVRVSGPNDSNNTDPDVVALSGGAAFVAWTLRDHPGTSIALGHMVDGGVDWIRENLALADDQWEYNGQVSLATDADDGLHVAWAARDVDAMLTVLESQVFYRYAPEISRTSTLPAAVPLADQPFNWTHTGPSLTLTQRHGAWVTWVRSGTMASIDGNVTILADSVLKGTTGEDIRVASFTVSPRGTPTLDSALGPDDAVVVTVSGVGSPTTPPLSHRPPHPCTRPPAPSSGASASRSLSSRRV